MEEKKKKEKIPLQYVKGVGPQRAEALFKAGLITPSDLLFYFPFSYIDRNASTSLLTLRMNLYEESLFDEKKPLKDFSLRREISIAAKITGVKEKTLGKNRKILLINIKDNSGGTGRIRFWNRIQYFSKAYKEEQIISVSGRPVLDYYDNVPVFDHPEIERIEEEDIELYSSGKILPKYRTSEEMKKVRITMRLMRQIVSTVLENEIKNIQNTLPSEIEKKHDLPDICSAIRNLHFPVTTDSIEKARMRVKFEELFYFELFLALRQRGVKVVEKGISINPKSPSARRLFDALPFKLTDDQKKVIREIASDMESGKPMNRLLQGDVGSGKTIVAILTMLMVIDNGFQVAFMAPTEILAEQHLHTLSGFLKDFGINIVQLVGGQRVKVRRKLLDDIVTGNADIIVGTHAMFESSVEYKKLGLVIIDEQHRFGVAQRAELKELAAKSHDEGNISPHVLVMTATPIPRTLSMTLYGDLDVSIIREMPKDRKPIITRVSFESKLDDIYDFIRKEIKKGHQVYIVYPLVEKSEKLELKAATEHYEMLRSVVFPDLKCGLLHGQMLWYEKEDTMKAFLGRDYDILVATTVIEVGIDIPNATVMLIENAERFGLTQLHQLRGRVGRSSVQSYCILVTKDHYKYQLRKDVADEDERMAAIIRLKTMEDTTDGFKISEVDLKLRGPGDLLGTRQSGLPDFKFADLVSDGDIITMARKEAFGLIESDPHLRKPENQIVKNEYLKRFRDSRNYFDIA